MYFSKSALLSLALFSAARADDIDLRLKVDIEGGPVYVNPPYGFQLPSIPCGGSQKVTFKVDYIGDEGYFATTLAPGQATMQWSLLDMAHETDEVGEVLETSTPTMPFLDDTDLEFTFKCTEWSEGCLLDYPGLPQKSIDGELVSYVRLEIDYKFKASSDQEEKVFVVGCSTDPVTGGDPHVKTWGGKWYDYMGECDMVFVDAPNFAPEMPMKINVRTKARYDYSFIESAVIQIGEETLEVGSWGEYFLNGVEGALLPNTISGYKITKEVESEQLHRFFVHLDGDENIEFKVYKDWVSVGFNNANHGRFEGSNGLIGSHDLRGKFVGRDGQVMDYADIQAYASEWQVQADEPMLFNQNRAPQAPQQCIMPEATQTQRRLGEQLSRESAIKACEQSGWSKGTIEMCIHDVMATGDLNLAAAGAM